MRVPQSLTKKNLKTSCLPLGMSILWQKLRVSTFSMRHECRSLAQHRKAIFLLWILWYWFNTTMMMPSEHTGSSSKVIMMVLDWLIVAQGPEQMVFYWVALYTAIPNHTTNLLKHSRPNCQFLIFSQHQMWEYFPSINASFRYDFSPLANLHELEQVKMRYFLLRTFHNTAKGSIRPQ